MDNTTPDASQHVATGAGHQKKFNVEGKVAIVTGAGSGINLCFARLLLQRGCSVVISDLSLRAEAQRLIEDYSPEHRERPHAVFVKTDVRLWTDLEHCFDEAEAAFGAVDIVCPGAGISEPEWSNFWHPPGSEKCRDSTLGTLEDGIGHYATLDINITHPVRTSQIAISRWLNGKSRTGVGEGTYVGQKRIVLISSIVGQVPGFSTPLYVLSKHAISGFTRSMGPLYRFGIRLNAVAPGIVKTPLWTDAPARKKLVNEDIDTWIEPEEVAEQMLRCCEDPLVGPGTVLEVLKNKTRQVGWRLDPGPEGPGSTLSNGALLDAEAFALLARRGWGITSGHQHSL